MYKTWKSKWRLLKLVELWIFKLFLYVFPINLFHVWDVCGCIWQNNFRFLHLHYILVVVLWFYQCLGLNLNAKEWCYLNTSLFNYWIVSSKLVDDSVRTIKHVLNSVQFSTFTSLSNYPTTTNDGRRTWLIIYLAHLHK